MLTRDRGTTLGDSHEATVDDWRAVVALAARLQRRLADHGPDLLAAGLPDCSPHTVPSRFAELTDALAALPREHPSHLDEAGSRRLRAASGPVDDAVGALLDGPLPVALFQHGDLHPGNVFAVERRLRLFDFGDAQWAYPLATLAVPWGWIDRLSTVPWPAVVEAYASEWSDVVSPAELDRLLPAAMVTHRSTAPSPGGAHWPTPRPRSSPSGATVRGTSSRWPSRTNSADPRDRSEHHEPGSVGGRPA